MDFAKQKTDEDEKIFPDFPATLENPLFFVYYAQEFALFDRIFWKAGILTNSGVSVTIDSGRATGAQMTPCVN